MSDVEKEIIKGEQITLDYGEFRNKRFEACKIIYKGGRPPILVENDFIGCDFIFENEAANTLNLLRGMVHGGEGGEDLVLQMLGIQR